VVNVAIAAGVADAGFWTLMPSLPAGGIPSDVEVAKMLLDDTWVDLQIKSNMSGICKSLSDCRRNGGSGTHPSVASSQTSLLAAGAGATPPGPPSEVLPQWSQTAASREQGQLAIESHAVALSLLLEHSCAKSESRRCLRSSHASARELRPITITFGDSHASKLVRNVPLASAAPLITSLSHFGLEFA